MSLVTPLNALSWQDELRQSYQSIDSLFSVLGISKDDVPGATDALSEFPLRVTPSFAQKMAYGDPEDPLLRQVLALATEAERVNGFSDDPLAEDRFLQSRVLQKYESRALLVTHGACPIHCRYCFRRHFPYAENQLTRRAMDQVVAELSARPSINEVILSGGDPLLLSDAKLAWIIDELAGIPSLSTLRIHTRVPSALPRRINADLLKVLRHWSGQRVIVVHTNHPAEIDKATATALVALGSVSDTLLNQSVLLKDINNNINVLHNLSRILFNNGVLPYYLHALDRVRGVHHFEVNDDEANRLMRGLSARLPGYLVPKFVREIPGRSSKTLLNFES